MRRALRSVVVVWFAAAAVLAGCAEAQDDGEPVGESAPLRCLNSSPTIDSFCMHPDHPELVRVGFHYSSDFGRTFWVRETFPGDPTLLESAGGARCLNASGDATGGRLYEIYDTLNQTFRRSDDEGASWRELPTPGPIGVGLRHGIAGYGARVAFFESNKLYRSIDAGDSFASIPMPGGAKAIIAAKVGPDGTLAVDAWTDGLYLSADFGDSWRKLDFTPVGDFALSPDGDIWVIEDIRPDMGVIRGGGVWHSTDRAATFRRRIPRWGPFDWREGVMGDPQGTSGVGFFFDKHLALGDGRIALAGRAPPGTTGRAPLLCVLGPSDPPDPGVPVPAAPPAVLSPGTMAPYAYVTDQIAAEGSIAVNSAGMAWWSFGGATVDTAGGNLFFAEHKDVIAAGCGGSKTPLPYRVKDLRYDKIAQRLLVLGDPDAYFPQDYVNVPADCVKNGGARGPRVWSFAGKDSALVGNTPVAPLGCIPSGTPQFNPLAKCDNNVCTPSDLFYCPADCGKGGLCGNKTCDAWEQLHCKGDCAEGYDGLCGNLKCDDESFEPLFCPYDCPPPLSSCGKKDFTGVFRRPRAIVPPFGLVTEAGVSRDYRNNAERALLYGPQGKQITSLADGKLLLLRDGWIRRLAIDAPDPCEVADRAPSASCHPSPRAFDRSVLGLVASERTGHLYVVADSPPEVLRRKLDGSGDWEVVVQALLRPLAMDLFETADRTVLVILDGDVWLAVPGDDLPLRRRF